MPKSKYLQAASSALFTGISLALFGLLSSGAGHGPYPKLSSYIMILGALIAVVSFVFLLGVLIIPKQAFERQKIPKPLGYAWVCPDCSAGNDPSSVICAKCGYQV